MAEIVNRGKIIIDLVAGSVEIPQPKFDQILPKQQEVNRATEAQGKATKEVNDRLVEQKKIQEELERTNQLILADRVRRHKQELARIEEEKRAKQRAIDEELARQRAVNEAIQKTAEGFLKISRAAVLLGFSQDESLQSLLKNLALVQAGFDAFDGSRKIVLGVKEAMAQASSQGKTLFQVIGTGNIALAAGTAAVAALAMTWAAVRREQEQYQKSVERAREIQRSISETTDSLRPINERFQFAQFSALYPTAGVRGSNDQASAAAERAKQAQINLLEIGKELEQYGNRILDQRQQDIEKQKTQLDLAIQRRDAERSVTNSIAAAFSQLSQFEQKRVTDIAKRGGPRNEEERRLFERAGDSGIAQASRAKEGFAEGAQAYIDAASKLEGATAGTSGSMKELDKTVKEVNESLNRLTKDKGFEGALNEIAQQRDEIAREFAAFQKNIAKNLRAINDQLSAVVRENQNLRNARIAEINQPSLAGIQ